jgi:hypothetical protein
MYLCYYLNVLISYGVDIFYYLTNVFPLPPLLFVLFFLFLFGLTTFRISRVANVPPPLSFNSNLSLLIYHPQLLDMSDYGIHYLFSYIV